MATTKAATSAKSEAEKPAATRATAAKSTAATTAAKATATGSAAKTTKAAATKASGTKTASKAAATPATKTPRTSTAKSAAKPRGKAKSAAGDDEDEVDPAELEEVEVETEAGEEAVAEVTTEDAASDTDDDEAKPVAVEPHPTGALVLRAVDDEDEVPVYSSAITGATADPVKDYLKQIGKVALLNAAEEVELAMRIEAGLFAEEKLSHMSDAEKRSQLGRELQWVAKDGQRAKSHLLGANLRPVSYTHLTLPTILLV